MIPKRKYLKAYCWLFALFWTCQVSSGQVKKDECNSTIINETLNGKGVIGNLLNKVENNILVCAHRGFHKYAPENSLKSIQDAIDSDIDIVELDIRTTKDSVLVLMHDESIDRTTNGKGRLKDYTFNQLQEFYLKIDDSITTHKIPKLTDALLASKNKVILNLDIKAVKPIYFLKTLKAHEMEHSVLSFIWDEEIIKEIVEINPLYAVLPLSSNKGEMEFNLESYQSPLQHFTELSYTPENMTWAHKNGVIVFINTLWDEDEDFQNGNTHSLDRLVALHPAIIQTDYPKLLVDYLKKKGLHQ